MNDRRRLRRVGAVVLVALLLATAGWTWLVTFGPCRDTLALEAPVAAFEFDRSGDAVTVTHDQGDAFTASNTQRLSVRLRDRETGGTVTATWASGGPDAFPVDEGDRITVTFDDAGRLSDGDTVTVVWVGYERPRYCPNRDLSRNVVGRHTLNYSDSTGSKAVSQGGPSANR